MTRTSWDNGQSDDEVLIATDLRVEYGDFVAVERANFSVKQSHCVTMIGPNGNGKSSIAAAVAGFVPRKGTVVLFGEEAPAADAFWMVKHGLSLVPERRQLFPRLTVLDNILLGCYSWTHNLKRARTSESTEEVLNLFPELQSCLRQLAGTLSGGQQQMTAIARGLAAQPKILVIDEPCLGLAEIVARRVYTALEQIKAGGRTVLLIEENPVRAMAICDDMIRVERGIVEGTHPRSDYEGAAATGSQGTTERSEKKDLQP